jgi:hypothetical protein
VSVRDIQNRLSARAEEERLIRLGRLLEACEQALVLSQQFEPGSTICRAAEAQELFERLNQSLHGYAQAPEVTLCVAELLQRRKLNEEQRRRDAAAADCESRGELPE